MKNNFLKFISITSGITAIVLAGAIVFTNSNLPHKMFLSRATNVANGTITFNGSDTTKSSTTYTTASRTQTGYPIKCIATNCDPANTGVVAAMQNGTIVKFYENNGSTEFEFQSIKSFSLTRSNWGTFSYTYSYVLDDGTEGTSDTINQTVAQYNQTVDLTELGTVVKLSLTGSSSTYIAMFTSIVLTYDCGPVIPKVLESISVTTAPTKTEYVEGDSFDPTGMVVTATYDDESTANVTSSCTFSPDPLTPSDTYVTISYGGKTTTQSISVEEAPELVSIAVTTAPTKTSYTEGDDFDPTGMVVTATYDDESTANVTSSCTFSPSENLDEGTTSVTVSYTENGITKTTTQSITVKSDSGEITSLSGTYITADTSYYVFVFNSDGSGYYQRTFGGSIRKAHFEYTISGTSICLTLTQFTYTGSANGNISDFANPYKPFVSSTIGTTNNYGTITDEDTLSMRLIHTTTTSGGTMDDAKSVYHTFTKQ